MRSALVPWQRLATFTARRVAAGFAESLINVRQLCLAIPMLANEVNKKNHRRRPPSASYFDRANSTNQQDLGAWLSVANFRNAAWLAARKAAYPIGCRSGAPVLPTSCLNTPQVFLRQARSALSQHLIVVDRIPPMWAMIGKDQRREAIAISPWISSESGFPQFRNAVREFSFRKTTKKYDERLTKSVFESNY
jgi:hypothetical protein